MSPDKLQKENISSISKDDDGSQTLGTLAQIALDRNTPIVANSTEEDWEISSAPQKSE
jgi:hypothetical protein